MKKIFSKEAAIGLVTLVSLFILYFGINYLKGINLFKPSNHYYVKIPNVSELQASSPIYVDGFKVGIVNKIDFGFNNPASSIVILISLDEKMRIQTGSYFELKSGLTSGAYLNLILNKYVNSYYQPGDTIEGFSDIGLMDKVSTNLLPHIENILPRLDSILAGLQTVINHPALSKSFEHIESTTANLQKSSDQLNILLSKDIPVISNNLKEISSNFATISSGLKELDLNTTLAKVEQVIENIDRISLQLNDKDNSMGLLLNDRSLYDNLDATAKNAADLLKDIKEHPKNYVRFSVF
ncbi:MAG: MlaD family protein [Dysgonamonadaceae bacterium]|jgi:phospholipid/cholesterol/gamma-HCH transport system substrate-binding protein|nr:MlaD family protein [Dysgonamonadaceae bacterium]